MRRVLVVEDDLQLAEPIGELLVEEGYQVDFARHGGEALARLRAADPPLLVLLDLMMPVMDGWEFLAQRKRDPALRQIPVVVMSADDSSKARAADADAFVSKPFDQQHLLDTVARLIGVEERRQGKLRDLRLDQLASLGRLAAGVAHEINNPLTWVAGNLALLEDELAGVSSPRIDELRELVRGALDGAERIGRIVGGLKMLVRPTDEEIGPVELVAALDSALNLAGNELRHRVQVIREYQDAPASWGSASRTTQLFLNLLLTAAQRIPEGNAADNQLRVSARAAGDRVVVELRDSGAPLTADGQRHLVDGLGMSICRQLVGELGAQLQLSAQGGSVMRVLLPIAKTKAMVVAEAAAVDHRRGRLLIIDDEPRIGGLLSRALGRDHEVTALTSAKEALTRIDGGERWDVILCDMMMPEMTGMELHAELSSRVPDEAGRMVFLTGGAFTPRAQAFLEHVPNLRLEKPIDMGRLRALVREQLAERG